MICETCGLLFRNRKTLHQHIKEIHSERVNIYKCDFCGRPFSRKFNLKKHLKAAHGTDTNAMSSSKQLTRDKLKENQKAVYVPLYEDISSDEEMMEPERNCNLIYAPEVEDISSDEEVFNNPDDDETLDLLSLNSEMMDSMLNDNEFHEDFVDDILKEAAFEEETIHEDSAPSENGEVAPEEENEPDRGSPAQTTTCITHSITLSLTRTTTVMPNGNTEVERRTNVCFSENIIPGDLDMEALIRDILSEIPLHFQAQRHRQCHGTYSV